MLVNVNGAVAVESAVADYQKGTVTLSLSDEISDRELKKTVEEQGYKFNS